MTEAANPAKPERSSVSANVEAQGIRPRQSQHLSMHLQHPPSPSAFTVADADAVVNAIADEDAEVDTVVNM